MEYILRYLRTFGLQELSPSDHIDIIEGDSVECMAIFSEKNRIDSCGNIYSVKASVVSIQNSNPNQPPVLEYYMR